MNLRVEGIPSLLFLFSLLTRESHKEGVQIIELLQMILVVSPSRFYTANPDQDKNHICNLVWFDFILFYFHNCDFEGKPSPVHGQYTFLSFFFPL
jgi:hypothetical protein